METIVVQKYPCIKEGSSSETFQSFVWRNLCYRLSWKKYFEFQDKLLTVDGLYEPKCKLRVIVKLFRSKSWWLRRGLECWATTITLTFGTTRTARSSALRHGHTYAQENSLLLAFVAGWVGPRATGLRAEGIGHLKISKDICKFAVLWRFLHITEIAGDFCGWRRERQSSVGPVQFVFRFGTVLKERL
jgi:hypothetical protein